MIDLLFSQPPASSTDLVFGAGEDLPDYFLLDLVGTLPGMTFRARLAPVTRLSFVGTLDNTLSAVMEVGYFSNTQRPIAGQATARAQVATPIESGNTQPEKIAQGFQAGVSHHAQDAVYAHVGNTPTFSTATPASFDVGGTFQDGIKTASQTVNQWQDGKPDARIDVSGKFQDGTQERAEKSSRFQDGHRDRRPNIGGRFQEARQRGALKYTGRAGAGNPTQFERHSRFQEAWPPRAGQYVRPITPPVPPPYWGPALLFQCPPLAAPNLMFGLYPCADIDPALRAPFAILPARFYMTAHSIYAQTLPDLMHRLANWVNTFTNQTTLWCAPT